MKKENSSWARLSDAARKNQIEYNQKNYSVIGCKLPRVEADAFRAYCAAHGLSVSAVLAGYIRAALASDSSDDPQK